jgi:hypothetical protein
MDRRESYILLESRNSFVRNSVKAVANGALAWHIDNTVSSRVSRFHYGTRIRVPYDKDDKDHKGRMPFKSLNREEYVSDAWSRIVAKVGAGSSCIITSNPCL